MLFAFLRLHSHTGDLRLQEPSRRSACSSIFGRLPAALLFGALTLVPFTAIRAQSRLDLRESHPILRSGERVSISASPDTLDFLKAAASLTTTAVADSSSTASPTTPSAKFAVHLDPNGSGLQLATSLTTPPGDYTVTLSATGSAGELRAATIHAAVAALPPVPLGSALPPVVLLDGYELGLSNCPFSQASDTFGSLETKLLAIGVPAVYFFDNCVEDQNGLVEDLGNVLGQFIAQIKYTNGAAVPQVDLVAHSMGGLIVRSYMAGLQSNGSLSPPADPHIRKFIEIAVPNFGSFLAASESSFLTSQGKELIPGSNFLWNLARWNQGRDDLRGVDALAIAGNAGFAPQSGSPPANASDGVVSLMSASLNFARDPTRTRILPYCHVSSSLLTLFVTDCTGNGISNLDIAPETGTIILSFLQDTPAWQSVGTTPASDPFLSQRGGVYFGYAAASGTQYLSDVSNVLFGTFAVQNGGASNTFFYNDLVQGTGSIQAHSASLGSLGCGPFGLTLGTYSVLRCKSGPDITSLGPLETGTPSVILASGGTVVITGYNFGAVQCAGCGVFSGTTPLQVLTWSDQSITAILPELSGSSTLTVQTASGADVINAFSAPPSLSAIGSLAHIVSEGTWDFVFNAVNLGSSAATARFNFLSDIGNPLPLPLTFPQFPGASVVAPSLDRTIAPNGQFLIESTGPTTSAQLTGWAQLLSTPATPGMTGFGIFSNPTYHWNALVPLETRNAGSYTLVFDNTAAASTQLSTGVALANFSPSAAAIPVILRDGTGAQIGTATINLGPLEHTSFMLTTQYPVTQNKLGSIEFDTPSGGQISVLGLRALGTAALTSLPVLASGDHPGGSIAHLAYNGGFTSTVYLINTGASPANFTLSFFADNGTPLSVPLLLPQTGATPITAALTQTLAPGAVLVVQTVANDAAASITGSAQLTTTGSVSAFEVFRWTTYNQESSVPTETRMPNSFELVFDNIGGLTTGLAVANFGGAPVNLPVTLLDDNGVLLGTGAIALPANGHTSFVLPDPAHFPMTANLRGIAQILVPAGSSIGVTGLRAKSDGTLTTIPVFTK